MHGRVFLLTASWHSFSTLNVHAQSARAFLESRDGFAAAGRRASRGGAGGGWKVKAMADETFNQREKVALGLKPDDASTGRASSAMPPRDGEGSVSAALTGEEEHVGSGDGRSLSGMSLLKMESGPTSGSISDGLVLGSENPLKETASDTPGEAGDGANDAEGGTAASDAANRVIRSKKTTGEGDLAESSGSSGADAGGLYASATASSTGGGGDDVPKGIARQKRFESP